MIDLLVIWKDVKQELSKNVSAVAYSLWIEDLSPLCVKEDCFVLLAGSVNTKNVIKKNFLDTIKAAFLVVAPSFADVFIIAGDEKNHFLEESENTFENEFVVSSTAEPSKVSPFIANYTFSNFVVGESNRLCFHAAEAVSQQPGGSPDGLNLNPLFIYGGVGLGKTHLLHSIGNYVFKHFPSLNMIYVPTEKLANDFIEALSINSSDKNSMNRFRDKYRNADILMLDDVQFLEKKSGLQDMFFHIFNELYQSGKQIILSSDRPPKEIGNLTERLVSRFEWGLLADIKPPNFDMRVAILRKKSINLSVPDEVIFYIAETFTSNIRELEGALKKVLLFSKISSPSPIPTLEIAKEALKIQDIDKKEATDSNDIIDAVCVYFRISKNDIIGKKRTKDLVTARMISMYLLYTYLNIPLTTIGQLFGGKDHTTVIHARNKIIGELKEKDVIYRQVNDIKNMLYLS